MVRSPVTRTRFGVALGIGVVATPALVVLATTLGSVRLQPSEVARALLGLDLVGRDWVRTVVLEVRLPRVLVAWLVGAALSLSGASLQTLFRNPLAEPSVLGVSGAASLFAIIAIYTGMAMLSAAVLPVAAVLGALIATLLLWGVGRRLLSGSRDALLLLGIAIGQVALAFSSLIVSLALGNWEIAQKLLAWMLGGLEGRGWMHALWGVGPVVACAGWLLFRARDLDALMLGDATATSLGVDVPRLRRQLVLVSALLAGISVAIGGVVVFVGLVVPHVVRSYVGPLHRWLLPMCLLTGGSLLVLADLLARHAIAPTELRLGVVTAMLGAPLFLHLLVQRARAREAP